MTSGFEADYYAANYPNYERQNPSRKLQHYVGAVRKYLPVAPAPRVLDVGCAFGRFVGAMDPSWQGFGADVSRHAIASAQATYPKAKFTVIDDESVPFADHFEAITAWDVIEHIPDLDRAARSIQSHLVTDGAFVFVVPVYDGPLGPVVQALDKDPTHLHKNGRQFWLEWGARHFKIHEWWGIFRYMMPGGYYAHFPTRALRSIAPAILVCATKKADGVSGR